MTTFRGGRDTGSKRLYSCRVKRGTGPGGGGVASTSDGEMGPGLSDKVQRSAFSQLEDDGLATGFQITTPKKRKGEGGMEHRRYDSAMSLGPSLKPCLVEITARCR